jgi:hypothetical protein
MVATTPAIGIPLIHVLKQARSYVDQQPLPPRGVMLRGRRLSSNDFRNASRILEHLILEQVAWEAVRRGAVDDLSFERLEEEVLAEVFPEGQGERPEIR